MVCITIIHRIRLIFNIFSYNLLARFTEAAHFGGGEDGDRRDRKTVIEELIADSKKRKGERSREHEEILDLTDKLDNNWRELLPVVNQYHRQESEHQEPDDYDRLVKEMIFMPRGEPTEKLKNEEDVARIEKERLETLERERLERMRGDEDEDGVNTQYQPTHRSADDLDDGYLLEPVLDGNDDERVISYPINPEYDPTDQTYANREEYEMDNPTCNDDRQAPNNIQHKKEKLEPESSEEEDDSETDEESEIDSLEDLKADESEEEQEVEPEVVHKVLKISTDDEKVKKVPKEKEKVQEPSMSKKHLEALAKIPYTIEMPGSYEGLMELLENQPAKIQGIIIDRIIKTNHLRLLQVNRNKMLKLFAYLLQYINDLFASSNEETVSRQFKILHEISPLMFDLVQMNPEEGSKCFLEVIKEKYEDYKKNLKRFPQLDTLVFFKLIGSLFPTSDFRHPIVTPSSVFLHHILSQSKVKTRSDVASGLFLVTLVLDYQQLSRKFLPSVMNFLSGLCYIGVNKSIVEQLKPVPPFKKNDSLLALSTKFKGEFSTSAQLKSEDFVEDSVEEEFKVRALNVTINLINDFVKLYDELVGMKYLLDPFETVLTRLADEDFLPPALKANIKKTLENFGNIRLDKKFKFPQLEQKVQPMIRILEPRFETVLSDRRSMFSQATGAKAEQQKLKHMVKREFKSAKRELRRDNEFISKIRHKRKQDSDRERQAKVKRIFNEASVQQSEYNALSRTKGRKSKF